MGMNDIVSHLVVDGEQQSDIKKVVLSPDDSTLKGFRLQRLRWWYDPEIKLSERNSRLYWEKELVVRPENAW